MNFPDLSLSEETARVLAIGGYAVMFFCMGLAPLLLRSERRNRRISENSPSNLSESDHPKASNTVSLQLPSMIRDRDRLAFGHAHVGQTLALVANDHGGGSFQGGPKPFPETSNGNG